MASLQILCSEGRILKILTRAVRILLNPTVVYLASGAAAVAF